MKSLNYFLMVAVSIVTATAANGAEGTALKSGESTIISGHPVSCEAPLPTEGSYLVSCKIWEPKFRIAEYYFVEKVDADRKTLRKLADEIIIKNNIDPNTECRIFGPMMVTEEEK